MTKCLSRGGSGESGRFDYGISWRSSTFDWQGLCLIEQNLSIKIFREAEIDQIFVVALVLEIGGAVLVLVDQAGEEGVGKIMGNLRPAGQGIGLASGGIHERVGAGQDDVRARPGVDREAQAGAVFDAGKTAAVEGVNIVAQKKGVGDDFGAEDLADVVADDLVDLVMETADGTTKKERLLGIGAGLVPEADSPKESVLIVSKIVAGLGVELELVRDRAIHAGPDGVLEAVLQVRFHGLIYDEWLEAQILPLGDEADVDLIAESGQSAVALVVPEVLVRGLEAQARLAHDQPVGLRADDVAVIEDAGVAALIAPPAAAGDRILRRAENVAARLVIAVEPAAVENDGVVANIVREASDADAKIVGENDIPTADDRIPGDLGADDGFIVEAQQIGRIKTEARDARLVLQRQIDKGSGDREAQPLGELRDDRAADRQDADGPGFAVRCGQVDIVAPEAGGGETLQFEKDRTELEVGVLRLEPALEQRKRGVDRRQSERGAGLDGLGLHGRRDGDPVERIRIRRSGIAENFGIRHARSWRGLVGSVRKGVRQAFAGRGDRSVIAELWLLGRCRGVQARIRVEAGQREAAEGQLANQTLRPPVDRPDIVACLLFRSRCRRMKKSWASCSRRKEKGR